jgi:hypothetical protein
MPQQTENDPWGSLRADLSEHFTFYSKRHEEQAKNFLQDLSDYQQRSIEAMETRLTIWLGFIVVIPCGCVALVGLRAGLALAAVVVTTLTLAHVLWRLQFLRKRGDHLHGFRERFRRRVDQHDLTWHDMHEDDRIFLGKCRDTILWPSVVAYERRPNAERLDTDDLEHVETILAEYGDGHHLCLPKEKCELCSAADRVRQHVNAALSTLESDVQSARQKLVGQCGPVNPEIAADTRFQGWMNWISYDPAITVRKQQGGNVDELLQTVYKNSSWNFDEADRLREIARGGKGREAPDYSDFQMTEFSSEIFDDLSRRMEAAADAAGVADLWGWYNAPQTGVRDSGMVARVRRAVGRLHADALFRELEELSRNTAYAHFFSQLANWGYDRGFVQEQRKISREFLAKDRNVWDRERRKQLRAAQAFIFAESGAGRWRCWGGGPVGA